MSAKALGARGAWAKNGCCTFPPERIPVRFSTDPGLPDWALSPLLAGVSWWTSDGGSHIQDAWTGADWHGSFDTCEGRSFVGFDDLRSKYGSDVRGVGTYCTDGVATTELHALLDANVDYSIAQVAAHEWGHGIGLDHSGDPNSVMYAFVNGVPGLSADDFAGVRALYPGSYALDIRPATVDPLTYGVSRSIDVRVRMVGGAVCPTGQQNLVIEGNPLLTVTVPPIVIGGVPRPSPAGEVILSRDSDDPQMCDGRMSVRLKAPTGGSTSLVLTPKGSVTGPARTIGIPLNRAPEASFDVRPEAPTAGTALTLQSYAYDLDGDGYTESWDLDGDGTFDDAYGPVATATLSAGEHTVGLRVSDGWAHSTTTKSVLVAEPPAPVSPVTPATPPGSTPGSSKAGTGSGTRPYTTETSGTNTPTHGSTRQELRITSSRSLRGLSPRVSFTGAGGEYATVSLRASSATARRLGLSSRQVAQSTVWIPPDTDRATHVRLHLRVSVRAALRAGRVVRARMSVSVPGYRGAVRNVVLRR